MKKLSILFSTICPILFWMIGSNAFAQSGSCAFLLEKADSIYLSNPDSSYVLSCLAEECALKSSGTRALAKACLLKAKYLILKSDLEEADLQVNKSRTLYKEVSDWKGLAYASKLKAILERRLGNEQQGIVFTEEAVSLFKRVNEAQGIISGLLNLSLYYTQNKQYGKAEKALGEVEGYLEKLSPSDMYYYYQNKGLLRLGLTNYAAAITCFTKALEVAETQQMIDSKATILTHLGDAYRLNGQYEKAADYLTQSREWSEKNNLDYELSEAYGILIYLYQNQGNYKEAYYYLQLQNQVKEKMLNIEKINYISMLEKKLALSEKQKEIEQEKLKTQQARQNSEQLIYLAGGITLVALFAIFMFLRTRSLHKKISIQNKNLEHKNHVIDEKQKEILDSIRYARRIQNSLLPSDKFMERNLSRLQKNK